MVEEGKITSEQAIQLMEAGNLSAEESESTSSARGKAKWLKVRVYDINTKKRKVNVSVPLATKSSLNRYVGIHLSSTS